MTDNTDLKRLAQRVIDIEALDGGEPIGEAWGEFEAAATPAAVLALIAENEALKGPHDWLAEDLIKELVDNAQAIQENADDGEDDPFVIVLLASASRIRRQEANIDKLRAENERLAKTADCWDRLNVQNKALSDSFRAERDQAEQDYKDVVGTIELRDIEISKLRAEVAGLRTGYEAYEQVNAELKAENERLERNRDMWKGQVERQAEELTALREEVTEWKDTVKFNEGCWSEERGTMIDKLQESRMRIKELDLLFGRYILAMRAAVIEEEHGLGAEGAMMWIYNSLVGPGELPPENETLAQAYFDREIVAVDNGMQEVLAFHEGRRAALGQGEQS